MTTRQQRWAAHSYASVHAHAKDALGDEKKYATLCMKAPSLLRQSGLVQALAFIRARNPEAGVRFVNDLARALEDRLSGQELVTRAAGADLPGYLAMSRDVIAIAIWFRRFAQTELASSDE